MTIPNTPYNFYVQQGNAQVFVMWDLVAGATSYTVQRSLDNITFSTLVTQAANQYTDTTAVLNTVYFYNVASVNGSGTSAFTSSQQVIPTQTGVLSLAELRLRGQQKADMVNSNFLTLPEWNFNINQSIDELYDILLDTYEDYYLAPAITLTADGTSFLYELPNGTNFNSAPLFYKLMGVDIQLSTTGFVTLNRFNFIDRNNYVYPNQGSSIRGISNPRYKVLGNKIMFIPTPSAGQAFRLWYAPRLPRLLAENDTFDGVSGWSEYVIVDSAIKAKMKEESPVGDLESEKKFALERIQTVAQGRDISEPATISNSRRQSNYDTGNGVNGNWAGC